MSDKVAAAVQAVAAKQGNNEVGGAPTIADGGSIPSLASTADAAPAPKDPRFEAFEHKERELRRKQQEYQAQKAEWESKVKQYETDYVPKSKLAQDPLSVLQDSGISLDQITEMLLNQPNPNDPATKAMLNKIKALEDKQAAIERQAQENTTKQYEQAIKQISNEVKMIVDSDPSFETIKASGYYEAVVELVKSEFEETGVLMDLSDAAKQVEEHLVNETYRLAQLSNVQKRFKPAEATAVNESPKTQDAKAAQGMKTLTNNLQTQPSKTLSDKERREKAIAAFYGKNG